MGPKVSGILAVICGPSGVGKTSLVRQLVKETDWELSVSFTTRAPRNEETEGVNYFYVDIGRFQQMCDRGEFLEHAKVYDHYYGTSSEWVRERLAQGTNIILEIDWQGAVQTRQRIPNSYLIMIVPPSIDELKQRLESRNQDPQEVIERRMGEAVAELSHYPEFDFLVVNETFETALAELKAILQTVCLTIRSKKEFLQSNLPEVLSAARGHITKVET